MNLTSGQELGSYRIVRLLGQGGMGAVYEVEHAQLGVRYALKTFVFEGGHDDLLKGKFLAEGKVLARLRHPNLVRVFDLDFDEATGTPYFVMDLVLSEDGSPRTLADVKAAELDEDRVLRWFRELASALDYIHAQGVVHRDIKLGNILLAEDGRVVLSDFGVSRFFTQNLQSEISALTTMVSEVGAGARFVMGTRGYMAPEVVRGEKATPAADAYSLGVMIVYLLTGIWYEPGSKVFRILETLEYRWLDVLPRLLAENPAERPAKLGELAVGLREGGPRSVAANAETSYGRHPSRGTDATERVPPVATGSMWQRVVLAIAGVAVVVVVVLGIISLSHRPAPSVSDEFEAAFGSGGIYEGPAFGYPLASLGPRNRFAGSRRVWPRRPNYRSPPPSLTKSTLPGPKPNMRRRSSTFSRKSR